MPLLYSPEQTQIRNEARRVLEGMDTAARLRALLERKGEFDADFWSTARDMGWTGIAVAEAAGGLGLGLVETLIVAEECGRAMVGAPFLATGVAAAHALAVGGDPTGVLPALASGERTGVLALTEGSEILPAKPVVRFEGGRVTGLKNAVLGAAAGNLAVVLAADGAGVPVLAVVDLDGPGVVREVMDTIDNSRGLAHLRFEGAPAAALSAPDALELAQQCLDRLALFLSSEAVGGADQCIALSTAYANERQAFGQAIGKFQAVKHPIAEMYVLNEMARASVLDAIVRLESGDADARAYVGAARLNAIQSYETAAAGATQVHGGLGVTWEADLHLHYRRSRASAMEAGAPVFWEDVIVSKVAA